MARVFQPVYIGPPPTDEQQNAARRACAENATDPGEFATFLSMLGLEEGQ